jgi:hypothetical protein
LELTVAKTNLKAYPSGFAIKHLQKWKAPQSHYGNAGRLRAIPKNLTSSLAHSQADSV